MVSDGSAALFAMLMLTHQGALAAFDRNLRPVSELTSSLQPLYSFVVVFPPLGVVLHLQKETEQPAARLHLQPISCGTASLQPISCGAVSLHPSIHHWRKKNRPPASLQPLTGTFKGTVRR